MSSEWEDSTTVVIIKSIVLLLFILIAVLGNGSVLYAVLKFKKLQTIPNYFVFNLAVADIMFALTGMPLIVVTSITKEWLLGDFMCNLCGLFNFLFCSVSIWTLVMISVNRYVAVAKAALFRSIFADKKTYTAIGLVWLFSFLITTPPLFGWSEYKPGSNTCLLNGKKHKSYAIFLVLIDFFLPFILLTVLYVRLFLLLRRQHEALARHSQVNNYRTLQETKSCTLSSECKASTITLEINDLESSSLSSQNDLSTITPEISTGKTTSKENGGLDGTTSTDQPKEIIEGTTSSMPESTNSQNFFSSIPRQIKRKISEVTNNKVERRVAKMLLVVIIAFFLSWTPFIISSGLYGLGAKPQNFRLMTLAIIIACSNSVINPFVYSVMNKKFRKTFKKMYSSLRNPFRPS